MPISNHKRLSCRSSLANAHDQDSTARVIPEKRCPRPACRRMNSSEVFSRETAMAKKRSAKTTGPTQRTTVFLDSFDFDLDTVEGRRKAFTWCAKEMNR